VNSSRELILITPCPNARAPSPATGCADPDIPETMPTFEWWGEPHKPYETCTYKYYIVHIERTILFSR